MKNHRLVVSAYGEPIRIHAFATEDEELAFECGVELGKECGADEALQLYRYSEFVALYPNVDLSGVEVRE